MQGLDAFRKKFNLSELTIFESNHWVWSVRPQQVTLGCGVVSLKRSAVKLSELTREEHADLDLIVKVIENTLQDLFSYDVMNYLMLMMVDKHVHFHVIPRYQAECRFFGRIWVDKGWPNLPDLSHINSDVDTRLIRDYIKSRVIYVNGGDVPTEEK